MKKLAVLALTAAGLLVIGGAAQAKEISSLKVCGASGCNILTDPAQLRDWESGNAYPEVVNAPGAQQYFTIEVGFGDGQGNVIHTEKGYWLSGSKVWRFAAPGNDWLKANDRQVAIYDGAAAGLTGFTPRLAKVTVKGKTAADPDSYMLLFAPYPYVSLPRGKLHLISIVLTPAGVNPFLPYNGKTTLRYEPKRRMLIRPEGDVRIPRALAKLVLKRASLNAETSSGSGGGTALYAGLGVGAIAALAVLGLARHKKMT